MTPSVAGMDDTTLRPFRVDVPQAALDDLQERLARVHWPDELPDAGWDYGVPLDSVKALVEHWRTALRLARPSSAGSTRSRSSPRRSTARTSTSSTCARPSRTRCR